MRAVTTAPVALGRLRTTALDRLRTIALAVALACTASGAYASFASVVINGFFVSASAAPGSFFFRADRHQESVLGSSGAGQRRARRAERRQRPQLGPCDPDGAKVRRTLATVASSVNVDPLTQVRLRLLHAERDGEPRVEGVNTALGNMLTSGSFCLWDSNTNFDGTSASCTGAGSLTFTLFYDLIVNPTSGSSGTSAYAELDVLGTGVPNGIFFDFASTVLGDTSQLGQSFSWTANLTAGNAAFFDLSGIVVA